MRIDQLDDGRRVRAQVAPEPTTAVVVVVDGGWHTERLAEALTAAGCRDVTLLGVDGAADDRDRLAECVLGVDPTRFAAHDYAVADLAPRWLRNDLDIDAPADRTAIWGASLGAEFALAMGLRHPDRFGAVLAASPGAGFQPPTDGLDQAPRTALVAGTDEPFFLANATRWARALEAAGAKVALTEHQGAHGDTFWFDAFPTMLAWALPH